MLSVLSSRSHAVDVPKPTPLSSSSLSVLGGVLLVFLIAFPWFAGGVFQSDEVRNLNTVHGVSGPYTPLDHFETIWAWRLFRPLDHLISPYLSDPATRESGSALLLHLPAVLALLLALRVAARRVAPDMPLLFAAAVIVWCVHTATSLALWQPDLPGQTWSGAAGAWLGLVLWSGVDHARAGGGTTRHAAGLALISLIGVLSKETFLGWCFAAAVFWLLVMWRSRSLGESVPFARWAVLAAGFGLVPVLYLSARFISGGLAEVGDTGGRYSFQFATVPVNMAILLLGFLPTGPSHAVLGLPGAALWVRALPGLAVGSCLALCLARPALVWWLGGREGDGPARTVALGVVLFTYLSLAAVFPTGRPSEGYLMGPNVGAALIVALGALDGARLLAARRASAQRRRWRAAAVAYGVVVLVAAGLTLYGLGSRARHVSLTWEGSIALFNEIETQQQAKATVEHPLWIVVPDACLQPRYSQIIIDPAYAVNVKQTVAWLNHVHPNRPLLLDKPESRLGPDANTFALPCAELPPRPQW
jgi:hypothetical protein